MRVIIAGSRTITDYSAVCAAVEQSGFLVTSVLSGMASGVDQLAIRYAREHDLPCAHFPADWRQHGRSAGYRRNAEIARNADALVAVHLNNSRGTQHMIDIGRKMGLKVYVVVMCPP